MPRTFRARLRFLSQGEGGRSVPAISGARAQLKLGELMTSCVVHGRDTTTVFVPEREHDVQIELLFGSAYGHLIDDAGPVELFEGSRLVALGRFAGPEDPG